MTSRRSPLPVLLGAAVMLAGVGLAVPARAQAPVWATLELPGPPSELAAAVGLDPGTPRARLLLEVIRIVHAAPLGLSLEADAARERLQRWLTSAPQTPVAGPRTVPSPLPPAVWQGLLGPASHPSGLAASVLIDRRASLLYYGLMGADEETRRFLVSAPELLQRVYERRTAAYAAFGRSLRVSGGRVVLPGGPASVAVWEALVGERASEPERFVRAALDRADGRFAFFLDTVAHLDEARQRFALYAGEASREARLDGVRSLARLFTDSHPEWRLGDRPFVRPVLDGSLVLQALAVGPDSRLAPPAARRFWETVFDGRLPSPADAGRWARDVAASPPADAAWLVGRMLLVDAPTGRQRLGAVAFAQRTLSDAPPTRLPDVAHAVRAFMDRRALVVALERLGVRDASVFRAAAERAAGLSAIGDVHAAAASLVQFQAALVLVDRLRARRALAPEQALGLVTQLVALRPGNDGRYAGEVGRWLETALLPALRGEAAPESFTERTLLSALAGVEPGAASGASGQPPQRPTVTLEGIPYVVDVARAELERLEGVRSRQQGNPLDAVLELRALVSMVESARTLANARGACRGLALHAERLAPTSWPAPGVTGALSKPADLLAPACERLRQLGRDSDLQASEGRGILRNLTTVADAVLADTLLAIVYALHLGDPTGAVELAPDVARRHRFGLDGSLQLAWTLPEERLGAGTAWHVSGSLIGLEHALCKLSLRLLVGQQMPPEPRLNDNERRTLALGLVLMNPADFEDDERDGIVAALERGRARLASADALRSEAGRLAAIAGWSEWRVETLRWTLDADPEALPGLLTMTDYFWAGVADSDLASRLDSWGTATTSLDGDLRLAWPRARPWEELAGRAANGQLTTRFVDLRLRAAETLARLGLPARLTPSVLAPALADLIHGAPLGHPDDWYALGLHATRLPEDRMLDYVASLTVRGPLAPADEGGSPGEGGT